MTTATIPSSPPLAVQRLTADAVDAIDIALSRAIGIVDLLQGAAAHGAIEEPSNHESLARALATVLDLLEEAHGTMFPEHSDEAADQEAKRAEKESRQ